MANSFSWIFDWLNDWLSAFGFSKNVDKVLFLGLDNAGKTTLLHMLHTSRLASLPPTQHPTSEELTSENNRFTVFDLGGHVQARRLWQNYIPDCNAIVFLIDSADSPRFEEAKKELNELLTLEALNHVPFLILGNKIDLPSAVSEEQLRSSLNLSVTTGKSNSPLPPNIRPIELFMCSVVRRQGFKEGFSWLTAMMK